jgi:hypothetical protein
LGVLLKLLFILSLLLSQSAFATSGKYSEELYITDTSVLKLIKNHPEFIVDHISKEGFELYGPVGTKMWIESLGVNFSEVSHDSGQNKDVGFNDYPTYEEIENFLKKITSKYPKISKLISIGKTVEGRDLWMVKISDNVEVDEIEPEFKFISSMHGNEITGRELTQFLIKDLLEGYGVDKKITELINNTEIYIMPSLNPDGSNRRQRANANGYDLNRNFPDWGRGDNNDLKNRQPETKSLMNFQASRNFSLSANFHGGAVVVNYPWDNTYDRHPLDELVKGLSLGYASLNPEMRNSRSFDGGITNGADWYVLKGGMQDWSYFFYNDLQITIELSRNKWPRYSDIPSYYKDNKASMLAYVKSIHQGAGFKLKNSKTSGRVSIVQKIEDGTTLDRGSYGFSNGEFFKVLPIGKYDFKVQLAGSVIIQELNFEVDTDVNQNGNYKIISEGL